MIFEHDSKYPFSGAESMFFSPIPPDSSVPKSWNTDGESTASSGALTSAGANFILAGIVPGDKVFLCSGTPPLQIATTVYGDISEHFMLINWLADQNYTNIVFKIGAAAQHTFSSLVKIISDRGIHPYTIKYSRCWSAAPKAAFKGDENGDVYIFT